MAKIVTVKRSIWDQLYLPAIVRGLSITLRHFFVNFFGSKEIETLRYGESDVEEWSGGDPESWRGRLKFRKRPERYRGRHRLMKRDDGTVRCTACMMCATICPANCIHIEAGERENPASRDIEKYPISFDIDELVCVVCGLCVEACPCDAIRMDTLEHVRPVEDRSEAFLDKDDLMSRGGVSIACDGGSGPEWKSDYAPIASLRQIYRPDTLYTDESLGYRNAKRD